MPKYHLSNDQMFLIRFSVLPIHTLKERVITGFKRSPQELQDHPLPTITLKSLLPKHLLLKDSNQYPILTRLMLRVSAQMSISYSTTWESFSGPGQNVPVIRRVVSHPCPSIPPPHKYTAQMFSRQVWKEGSKEWRWMKISQQTQVANRDPIPPSCSVRHF